MQCFQIGINEAGQRLDKYLKKLLAEAPGSFIYKMLRKKNITLNGKKAGGAEKLEAGDEVKLFFSEETFEKFSLQPQIQAEGQQRGAFQPEILMQKKYPCIPLDILYEDEDILVINKPAGMLSQKAKAGDVSANEYIIGYLLKEKALTKEQLVTFRPSVCNRLDRNTSGILVAGKTLKGLQDMANQLRERSMEKYYWCLVKGRVSRPQVLKGWLWKDEGSNQVQVFPKERPGSRYIETGYVPVKRFRVKEVGEGGDGSIGQCTLLEVRLATGRTHQIRAHLAAMGHPVFGDGKYGDKGVNQWLSKRLGIRRQLLHASRMKFPDGREIIAPLGEEFQRALDYLAEEGGYGETRERGIFDG